MQGRVRAPLVLPLLVAALAGCSSAPPGVAVGAAPAWSFTDTEGAVHSNATAAGHPSLLFFMATWCGSCRATTPALAAVHREFEDRGLQVFSVTVERGDDDAALEAWKAQYHQPWPHGRDPSGAMPRTFEIVAQSSVVVLDAEGRVVQRWGYGQATEPAMRAAVERAFAA